MRSYKIATFAISVLFCAFSCLSPLKSQETRGTLLGRVTDPSGAVVAGGKVEVTNTQTGVSLSSTTNESGDYTLPFLIPGIYTLKVQAGGFSGYTRENIEIRRTERIPINPALQVGSSEQSIDVTSQSPILDTSPTALGQVITGRNIEELPLKDGTPLMLATVAPGVSFTVANGSAYTRPFDTGSPSGMTIYGGRLG